MKTMNENYAERYAECRVFTSALQVDFEHEGSYSEDAIRYAIYAALESCKLEYEDYVDFSDFGDITSCAEIDFHWNEADGFNSRDLSNALDKAFTDLGENGIFYDGMCTEDVSEFYDEYGNYIG